MSTNTTVLAATLGSALGVVIAWGLGLAGADVPPEVASAISAILTGGIGLLVPSKPESDTVKA